MHDDDDDDDTVRFWIQAKVLARNLQWDCRLLGRFILANKRLFMYLLIQKLNGQQGQSPWECRITHGERLSTDIVYTRFCGWTPLKLSQGCGFVWRSMSLITYIGSW